MKTPPRFSVRGQGSGEALSLPLADARRLPAGRSPSLTCRFYDCPKNTLPNGLARTTPLVADAVLVIGGSFLVTARILRDGPDKLPSWFQIERQARDLATGQMVPMPLYAPELIRAAYDVMASRQVLVNARLAMQKARN